MKIPPAIPGMVHLVSPYTVSETLDRLAALAAARGLTLFARIDFAHDAASAGLSMPPSQLLILGNPKAGTPLMLTAPTSAIDLPLKALAWQDAGGNVWLSSNTSSYVQHRHNLPVALRANIDAFEQLLEATVKPA